MVVPAQSGPPAGGRSSPRPPCQSQRSELRACSCTCLQGGSPSLSCLIKPASHRDYVGNLFPHTFSPSSTLHILKPLSYPQANMVLELMWTLRNINPKVFLLLLLILKNNLVFLITYYIYTFLFKIQVERKSTFH